GKPRGEGYRHVGGGVGQDLVQVAEDARAAERVFREPEWRAGRSALDIRRVPVVRNVLRGARSGAPPVEVEPGKDLVLAPDLTERELLHGVAELRLRLGVPELIGRADAGQHLVVRIPIEECVEGDL